jgi:hypothetical protein
MFARIIQLTRTLAGVALVVAMVSLGMTSGAVPAGAATDGDSMSSSALRAPDDASVRKCSANFPPSGSVLKKTYYNPNACKKCELAGAAIEALGGLKAYCLKGTNWNFAELWTFCVACREGEDTSARLNIPRRAVS